MHQIRLTVSIPLTKKKNPHNLITLFVIIYDTSEDKAVSPNNGTHLTHAPADTAAAASDRLEIGPVPLLFQAPLYCSWNGG
jgi:hypothetical protein